MDERECLESEHEMMRDIQHNYIDNKEQEWFDNAGELDYMDLILHHNLA
ncbi:MAG: hypothetical protein KGI33_08970 [Thaumarchaeota archaeon]|nr:hypothetical protein [Nitrososphaerota archaeon]